MYRSVHSFPIRVLLNQMATFALCNFSCTSLQLWFDVCVTVHHWYNNINSQLDGTIIVLLIISFSSTCFGRQFRPSLGALDCVYSLWYNAPTVLPAGDQDEVSLAGSTDGALYQCFSDFVRPRPGKFFFHKTRARSQQIYSSVPFQFFLVHTLN